MNSEIKKSRVFQGCFSVFSGALEARNENNNIYNKLFKTKLTLELT